MSTDRGNCPYFLYYRGEGPSSSCNQGCWEEPSCVTDEPQEGWPSANARDAQKKVSNG